MLKHFLDIIITDIVNQFKLSTGSRTFPESLKTTRVTHAFKSGDC